MHSKYNGYSFPLRDTVKREKVHFRNRCRGRVWPLWSCEGAVLRAVC